ncbi:hypothetical protein BJY04DRAFT_215655 [Aspergillus karnatakaensis]|uniref:uncharacterized protein n=1 Tax=Aspergillus karnatakaensis TaxID=1810916 RepID=UPI003CCE2508
MAYGTVLIHFKNGTIRDLGWVNWSGEHLIIMKELVEEAVIFYDYSLLSNDTQTYSPRARFYPPIYVTNWMCELRDYIVSIQEKLHIRTPAPPREPTYPSVSNAYAEPLLEGMFAKIKSELIDPLRPPLEHNDIFLTWPDFEAHTVVSYHALEHDGIELDEFDLLLAQGYDYESSGPKAMLVLSYNEASLGITLHTRVMGGVEPWRLAESPEYGASNNNGSGIYWDGVKKLIEDIIQEKPVDHLLLLGSHAYNGEFIKTVGEVLETHPNINSSILDRYNSSKADTVLDEIVPLFMAARQAAKLARGDMETSYQKQPLHCFVYANKEELGKKHSEL